MNYLIILILTICLNASCSAASTKFLKKNFTINNNDNIQKRFDSWLQPIDNNHLINWNNLARSYHSSSHHLHRHPNTIAPIYMPVSTSGAILSSPPLLLLSPAPAFSAQNLYSMDLPVNHLYSNPIAMESSPVTMNNEEEILQTSGSTQPLFKTLAKYTWKSRDEKNSNKNNKKNKPQVSSSDQQHTSSGVVFGEPMQDPGGHYFVPVF